MQVAGLTNDHLMGWFRFEECITGVESRGKVNNDNANDELEELRRRLPGLRGFWVHSISSGMGVLVESLHFSWFYCYLIERCHTIWIWWMMICVVGECSVYKLVFLCRKNREKHVAYHKCPWDYIRWVEIFISGNFWQLRKRRRRRRIAKIQQFF